MNQRTPIPRYLWFVIAMAASFAAAASKSTVATQNEERKSAPIPMDQLGAVAGKQYQGDGLSVIATADGARLRCAFQRLEGQVTREGLWLSSTADSSSGERFRVKAMEIGRVTPCAPFQDWLNPGAHGVARPTSMLPTLTCSGIVNVADNVARFIRPGLTEEYSVSVDGIRQDFLIEQPPAGDGELRVELEVTGARVEPLVNGAQLVLAGSGRKLAYNRLRVVDATGRELPARMAVASGILPDVEGAHPAARNSAAMNSEANLKTTRESAGLEAPALRQVEMPAATKLAVMVDDSNAVYPVRIDPTFSDADWISMGGFPGANNSVNDTVVDGLGNLYIGGNFTVVGDVFANRIAKWDGSTWSALGLGVDGNVAALTVSGTNLYAGGSFGTAGGTSAIGVAKWDGAQWSALGTGMNSAVYALAASEMNLYVGGEFTIAGGIAASHIAKWDGNSWSALGSGMGPGFANPRVTALALSGTDLYAGGGFTTAGGQPAKYVAKWDGAAWSALGAGTDSHVYALAMNGTNLYVGGWFTNAGGMEANRIAKWDGTTWSALGAGLGGNVYALAVAGTNLYVGGDFTTAGAGAANRVAKWDGSAWSALSSGASSTVSALSVSGSLLYAGGLFNSAGGNSAMRIAGWDGNAWTALDSSGLSSQVSALALSGGDLFVGGNFVIPGIASANRIAKWDGSDWSALGGGINGSVNALAVSGTDVFAGGSFTLATNTGVAVVVNRIAKWNGTTWSALGLGLSGGPNEGWVGALAIAGPDLYAAGMFNFATNAGPNAVTANHIAKWNGSTWSALGSGMNSRVLALTLSGTNLYAGGEFNYVTNTGPIALIANGIARWDGGAWAALGSGLTGGHGAFAIAVSGTDVYAGGFFSLAGGNPANGIAKWNGGGWSALGSGPNGDIRAMAIFGTNLYVGGSFSAAGVVPAKNIAKWDGNAWSALGSGMNNTVRALTVNGINLFAGGDFTTAGNKVSTYVAKANISGLPFLGRFTNSVYSPATGFSCMFLDASVGQPYRIQTSPSLAAGSWTDFTNFTYTGPIVITDASALSGTNKFFRAITP